jgi:prepilin-type processing-associated H-X9-DG protein
MGSIPPAPNSSGDKVDSDRRTLDYASWKGYERQPARWSQVALNLVVIVLILIVMTAIVLPMRHTSHPPSRRVACMSNLRQLGLQLHNYAKDNGGRFPDSWETFISTGYLTGYRPEKLLVCPMSKDVALAAPTTQALAQTIHFAGRPENYFNAKQRPALNISYIYCGNGLTSRSGSRAIIVYEPLCDHQNGMNALFADGHVEFLPLPMAQQAVATLQARQTPSTTGVAPP